MGVWRLLKLETSNAFTNMAIDEAILTARIARKVSNTLRFYRWKPSAVSIGRFQKISNEVHVENCRKHGVDIVRRITGGGAVYHDYNGEITYSVVVDGKNLGCADVISAYKTVCSGLIEAVKILGTKAEFNSKDTKHCPNITLDGRKISGSAQCHRRGVMLQHGTFLVDIDFKRMFMFLKVPQDKKYADIVNVAHKKLTSMKRELGSGVSLTMAYQGLVKGFQKALNIQLMEGALTSYERDLAEKLRRDKFATDDWNFKGQATHLG